MSTKSIIKITGGVLFLTLLILAIINYREFRALLHIPNEYISVENENSELLKLLPLPDDFSSDFFWSAVLIRQSSYDSGEKAVSSLHGFYQWFEFSMQSEIKQFANVADLSESSVEADFAFPRVGELSYMQLAKISESQKTTCYYWIDNSSECDVVIVYEDKVIGLQVRVEAGADKAILEKLLNSLLLVIKEDIE